jgi:hypothetical protein
MPAAAYCAAFVIRSVVTELGDTTSTTSSTSAGRIGRLLVPNNPAGTTASSGVRYDGRSSMSIGPITTFSGGRAARITARTPSLTIS